MLASNAAAPVLELRDVSKSFGPVVALRSGSLRVEAGSIHALIGENGAGKSTMMKILSGYLARTAGCPAGGWSSRSCLVVPAPAVRAREDRVAGQPGRVPAYITSRCQGRNPSASYSRIAAALSPST